MFNVNVINNYETKEVKIELKRLNQTFNNVIKQLTDEREASTVLEKFKKDVHHYFMSELLILCSYKTIF